MLSTPVNNFVNSQGLGLSQLGGDSFKHSEDVIIKSSNYSLFV